MDEGAYSRSRCGSTAGTATTATASAGSTVGPGGAGRG